MHVFYLAHKTYRLSIFLVTRPMGWVILLFGSWIFLGGGYDRYATYGPKVRNAHEAYKTCLDEHNHAKTPCKALRMTFERELAERKEFEENLWSEVGEK